MLDLIFGKKVQVDGVVERIGAIGRGSDTYFVSILMVNSTQLYTLSFDKPVKDERRISLTRPGDAIEFECDGEGYIKLKSFINKTVNARLDVSQSST